MEEQRPPEPIVPRPFERTPRPVVPPTGGCAKAGFIGCGLLLVLLGIGAVLFVSRADDLFVWLMQKLEAQVMANLADDVSAADRDRLASAFDEFGAAFERDAVDPEQLARLQRLLMETAGETGPIDTESARALAAALEAAAGRAPPVGPAAGDSPGPTA